MKGLFSQNRKSLNPDVRAQNQDLRTVNYRKLNSDVLETKLCWNIKEAAFDVQSTRSYKLKTLSRVENDKKNMDSFHKAEYNKMLSKEEKICLDGVCSEILGRITITPKKRRNKKRHSIYSLCRQWTEILVWRYF